MQEVRQKSTAGVSGIRRGHFFAVRRSRCPHICKREVINMLLAEYDYETDIAVQRAEEREIAFAEGIEQGIADGVYQKAIETAKLMRYENLGIDLISKVTGLSVEEIKAL